MSPEAIARAVRSPGPPEEHLGFGWWHVDLIVHLNAQHTRPDDDDRPVAGWRRGDRFDHTLACPMEIAHSDHAAAHRAGQEHGEEARP